VRTGLLISFPRSAAKFSTRYQRLLRKTAHNLRWLAGRNRCHPLGLVSLSIGTAAAASSNGGATSEETVDPPMLSASVGVLAARFCLRFSSCLFFFARSRWRFSN
jgi:hypothetical protein